MVSVSTRDYINRVAEAYNDKYMNIDEAYGNMQGYLHALIDNNIADIDEYFEEYNHFFDRIGSGD